MRRGWINTYGGQLFKDGFVIQSFDKSINLICLCFFFHCFVQVYDYVYHSHDMAMCETYIRMFIMFAYEHRNLETRKHLRLLSSGTKLFFLLPLSLKVLRHKERDTHSFYSSFFDLPSPPKKTRVAPATRPLAWLRRASESQPSSFEAGLNSTPWLTFSNLLKYSARFRCVTLFALPSPVSHLGLLWHPWVTRSLRPRVCVNSCVNVASK